MRLFNCLDQDEMVGSIICTSTFGYMRWLHRMTSRGDAWPFDTESETESVKVKALSVTFDVFWACLDLWKWEKNRKWKKLIFLLFFVCFESKMRNEIFFLIFSFPFYTSFLNYYFLTYSALQLILWSCKSHL